MISIDEIVCHVKGLGYGCDLMDQSGQGEGTVDLIVSLPTLEILFVHLKARTMMHSIINSTVCNKSNSLASAGMITH